ncbi:MAG TPA: IclR family transcriptional regulator [Bordetella sp.]|nr:IclR family transcriptional regulator [Bordetella sp.]
MMRSPAIRSAPADATATASSATPVPADSATAKNTVQSLAKGFRLLEAFTAQEPELTMAEAARRAGLDNATAFRFLNTLVDIGYVERVPDTRLFRLTTKVLDLGFNAIAHSDLRTRARPILRELVGEVSEAASIGVLEGGDILYAERIQAGLTRLGVDIRIGSRVPAYCTAVGHSILAWLPRDTQIRILESQPRQKLTDTTVTDLDTILARLEKVRADGYAVSNQETVSGLYVIAAPVLDVDGIPLAGLSVASPAFRTSLAQFEAATVEPVRMAARNLSKVLQTGGGYTAPLHTP